ncbi:hypothetical protein D3C81_1822250 [compost metagenome]
MKCELLACLCSRRAQLRDIKNCRQITKSVKNRSCGAGQADMACIEVVILVNDDGLSRHHAGAYCTSPRPDLRPFRSKIKPSFSKLIIEGRVAHKFDRDSSRIREQQHVALIRHLPEKGFEARSSNAYEFF